MNQATYQVQVVEQNSYAFMSIGKKGIILKVVEFAEIREGIYNLGFGDYDFATKDVDDKTVSDNGDTEKVLATVVGIVREFIEDNPTCSVFVAGSTPSRTRLY